MCKDTFGAATLVKVIVDKRDPNERAPFYEFSLGRTKAIVGLPKYERATR
jgi:hypothetical protein